MNRDEIETVLAAKRARAEHIDGVDAEENEQRIAALEYALAVLDARESEVIETATEDDPLALDPKATDSTTDA